ncbi:MAG TPA: hypothetical protein VN176_11325 [Verrucomicrobiae bacterium]|jgi:hypothetical protein|nr:hypothetical protein [Verrucomicrobiae bacterium]
METADLKHELQAARHEIESSGGLRAFRSGEWIVNLVRRTLAERAPRGTQEHFLRKYPGLSLGAISKLLAGKAARRTALAGALAGAAVSMDEIVAFVTAGEAGLGIPANVAIALGAICAELFFVTKVQLRLIADVAALSGARLDDTSVEDVLTLFALAVGGKKPSQEPGKTLTPGDLQRHLQGELRRRLARIAKTIGARLLKRSAVRAAVPGLSILMSASSNYTTTKAVARAAQRHFGGGEVLARRESLQHRGTE